MASKTETTIPNGFVQVTVRKKGHLKIATGDRPTGQHYDTHYAAGDIIVLPIVSATLLEDLDLVEPVSDKA